MVRRERGLSNERGPKARLSNKHSALLQKHTCYKSLKTSAIVTHASAGTGLTLTRQHTHAVYVSGGTAGYSVCKCVICFLRLYHGSGAAVTSRGYNSVS